MIDQLLWIGKLKINNSIFALIGQIVLAHRRLELLCTLLNNPKDWGQVLVALALLDPCLKTFKLETTMAIDHHSTSLGLHK